MNTIDQLMAVADAYADQYRRSGPGPLTAEHRNNLRAALEQLSHQWVPVTQQLLDSQVAWLYKPMWIALKDGRVVSGSYCWEQGRDPDRLIGPEIGDVSAFVATHVAPIVKPTAPNYEQ